MCRIIKDIKLAISYALSAGTGIEVTPQLQLAHASGAQTNISAVTTVEQTTYGKAYKQAPRNLTRFDLTRHSSLS